MTNDELPPPIPLPSGTTYTLILPAELAALRAHVAELMEENRILSLKSIHGLLQKAGSAIPNDPDLWKENLSYSKTFRRDDFLLLLDIAVRLHTRVAELELLVANKDRCQCADNEACAFLRRIDRLQSVLESTTTALDDLANAMAQASADCSQTPGCWDPTGKITAARYETEDALDAARKALEENA